MTAPSARPSATPRTTTLLLTVGAGAAHSGVVLGLPGAAPATGELDPASLGALRQQVAALLRPAAGLLLADSDVHAAARERQAGELLAGLLEQPGLREVRDALVAWGARGEPLCVAIDARSTALRDLPWELLAAIPPGRSPLAAQRVLRVQPAAPPAAPEPADQLELRLWVPDADDPVTASVAAALEASVADLQGVVLRRLPADLSGGPTHAGPAVLHLLTHGSAALDRVTNDRVGLAGTRAAETVTRALGPWASGCLVALTDVCAGAQATADPADAPTWRLAMGGPPVVVGPRTRWGAEASIAFSRAFYAALGDGEPIAAAVDQGRLALRMQAVAHESCRWWAPLTVVTTPAAAGLRLVRPPLTVPGWPRCGAGAGPLLRSAVARAQGYLGVEHLVAALADPLVALPDRLLALRPAMAEAAAACPPQPLAGDARPSPRLAAIGAELPAGFEVDDLARHLALVPWLARVLDPAARARLLAPPADDGHGTLPLEPTGPATLPPSEALVFEVEAGPEDGRLLVLRQPGDLIGRWDPGLPAQRHNRLQCDRDDADRTLSRQHLTLLAGRQVNLRGATRLVRGHAPPRPVQGPLLVQPRDVLIVGASTRLRAL